MLNLTLPHLAVALSLGFVQCGEREREMCKTKRGESGVICRGLRGAVVYRSHKWA